MKTRKVFIVIAYDIADDKRRSKIVKELERCGHRVNFSVFECMLTSSRFIKLRDKLNSIADKIQDQVIYYHICLDCYTKIEYLQNKKYTESTSSVI